MSQKIKQFTSVLVVLFLVVMLLVGVLTIWDVIDSEMAKDLFAKVSYTFGAILAVSLVVMLFTKKK